jgi:hypothetical protein
MEESYVMEQKETSRYTKTIAHLDVHFFRDLREIIFYFWKDVHGMIFFL